MKTFIRRGAALIVEDLPLFNEVLAKACRSNLPHYAVLRAHTISEARKYLATESISVLILDLRLPDGDGCEFALEARKAEPSLRILAISAYCDGYTVLRIMRSGIMGLVDKSTATLPDLFEALSALGNGRRYFSRSIENATTKWAPYEKIMSPRQLRILHFASCGLSDEDIAVGEGIAAATIKWHRKQIMHKLSLNNRCELILFALRSGFSAINGYLSRTKDTGIAYPGERFNRR
jgi:DNA-binding NarL/FixJ family response regulator